MWVMETQGEELGQRAGNEGGRKNRCTGRKTTWVVGEKSSGMRRQKKVREYRQKI